MYYPGPEIIVETPKRRGNWLIWGLLLYVFVGCLQESVKNALSSEYPALRGGEYVETSSDMWYNTANVAESGQVFYARK